ncbi:MAG: phospho-sugar mutase [Verrucomicrobiota bacterium]
MSTTSTPLADAFDRAGDQLLDSTKTNLEAYLANPDLPDWARTSVEQLLEAEAWTELNDRFFKTLAFGTGGIRGRTIGNVVTKVEEGAGGPLGRPEHAAAGTNCLNVMNVRRAAMALGQYLLNNVEARPLKVVISHDTRHFSRDFTLEAADALAGLGIEPAIFESERSTPQLSFSVRWLKAHAGIMITASHNPPHDNGFKAYWADGCQLVEPYASGTIEEFNALASALPAPVAEKPAVTTLGPEADSAYLDAVSTLVLEPEVIKQTAGQMKFVYTPIHGVSIKTIPALLDRFGFQYSVVPEQAEGDARFPTVKSPNPENAEALELAKQQAEKEGADLVIGTDPDDDRMGVYVRNGRGEMELLTGNKIGSIMAHYRCERFFGQGILNDANKANAALIKTIVTTDLQKAIAECFGVKCVDTLTGFKYIGEKMGIYQEAAGLADYDAQPLETRRAAQLEKGTFFIFGGEESYGYSGADYVRDKDANAATLMFAEAAAWAKSKGITLCDYLDEIYREFGYFLEKLGTLAFEGAAGAQKIQNLLKSLKGDPPAEMAGSKVTRVENYAEEDFHDVDGKLLPKENVLMFHLENGSRMAVRASGTEPKIKFYFFTQAPVEGDLEAVKAKTVAYLEEWWAEIMASAKQRAEG